ncbi:bifunctional phosphoribosyl-AMP cyclohydrolase/phosphoribosyl-ATP diphosphatase HisIE [Alicyclobacillus mali]|uniref:Histidine biosynthesis bifunctional protein HisIE n=1 Tax=Alicyclobacillus mali (ex Roth et al. 2021) TaxID=1123961 RepID=A0ABS0F3A1_9BACL|nr:bifunctional phosphoribosyl-AMP cyclohydrolase/phosphoribosyl-ATP diphosphatase HisIE [Alicyclobacillus mali (ex Roth et al. 2021)]MBF8377772.1 bifunctional phosphoribosyl-AMP cyclohydrolase/phosphoribosyl-ATP diphosphatase HisIE [Alicyclobacillus mali (ex Roth et al. 2021)]
MAAVKGEVELARVRYDAATGLVPVVAQDAETGDVLMLAYADREALKRTLATGYAWYYSRSRRAYWRKGATSGNVQRVVEVRVDCDGDAVLYRVVPEGPACHTGEQVCFYRRLVPDGVSSEASKEGGLNPEGAAVRAEEGDAPAASDASGDVPGNVAWDESALARLWGVIDSRYRERPDGSYTTYLFTHGAERMGKKIGEEAVEVALAGLKAERDATAKAEVASESADLLYHLLVLWRHVGVQPSEVWQVLEKRA